MKSVQVHDKSVWEKGFSLLNLVIWCLELLGILSGVVGCLLSLPLHSDSFLHLQLQIHCRRNRNSFQKGARAKTNGSRACCKKSKKQQTSKSPAGACMLFEDTNGSRA